LPAALDGLAAEIVVVDNASTDDSAELVAGRPGVRLVRNESNAGYAHAMNQAYEGCEAPVFIALNPDTVPRARSLALLVERLLADPGVGLIAPKLINPDGTTQHSVYRFPSLALSAVVGLLPARMHSLVGRTWWLEGHADHEQRTDIDWAIGAVHCVRTAALLGESPYSERWFMYVEDLDLCWQLRRRGWRIALDPDAVVVHEGNAAGSQAWGEGRRPMWMVATYDWYRLERGPAQARAWALLNTCTVAAKFAFNRLTGHREWAHQLRQMLPVHVRALVGR
jgi:GT2 family glycosyltransferase